MSVAIVAGSYGGPEVLETVDVDVPAPGPGEVTVAVRAAGVNPIDYKLYSGVRGDDPANLPMRVGFEAAGVVTAVGADARGDAGPIAAGDEVIVFRASGTYAESITVPGAACVPKPPELAWEAAAGLMLAGTTAVHALTTTGVGAGDTVLIHGVAGGVGLLAAQLALENGATVVGTAAEHRFDTLRGYGIVPVTYGDGLADRVRAAAPQGVDAALDAVGTDEAIDVSLELVSDPQRIVTIVAYGRATELNIKGIGNGPGADPGTEIRDAARTRLTDLAGAGKLEVVVARTFPLAEAAAAHRLVLDGHAGGKVVLVP